MQPSRNLASYLQPQIEDGIVSGSDSQILYGANSLRELHYSQLMTKRLEAGQNVLCDDLKLVASAKEWKKFIRSKYSNMQIFEMWAAGTVRNAETEEFIMYSIHDEYVDVDIMGGSTFLEQIQKDLLENFEEFGNYIKWVYSDKGDYVRIQITKGNKTVEEMYPFLKEKECTLEDYYTNFMKSSSNILLLIGPPGTGKTTFLRGLLDHTDSSAIVTYDLKMLNDDSIFAGFIESDDENVMIMEDADNFLEARSEGNNMMHRFLNVADGLVSNKNKKIIFSTNLKSTDIIDPALIRPGRCFDILKFGKLTREEAEILANRLNVPLKDADEYTVATVLNKEVIDDKGKEITEKIPMGFGR